jgi:subtilisin family serine protease
MKLLVLSIAFLLFSQAQAKTLKVAVVDTGLDLNDPRLKKHLCRIGHADFTGEGIEDTHGHGTNMVGLIEKYAGLGNYCLVIYKYYSKNLPDLVNIKNEIKAFKKAVANKVRVVNFSSSGTAFDEEELGIIKNNPKVTFVVAAGNNGVDIDLIQNASYPAGYFLPNEIVVGSTNQEGKRSTTSNYSRNIIVYEMGENVYTTSLDGYTRISGTSESTAIHTGKLIRNILDATR